MNIFANINFNRTQEFVNRNFRMIMLVLVGMILLWVMMTRQPPKNEPLDWIKTPHPSGKYEDSNPYDRMVDLIDEFGSPDMIDKKKGGSAVWKKETLEKKGCCLERLVIIDEQIPHDDPAPHTDFLYGWYKLDVPEDKINDVRALSKSVTYDPLKKVVSARCHFMGAVMATLLLAKRIAQRKMTLKEAKEAYGPYIFATVKEHKLYKEGFYEEMKKELCN